MRLASPAVDRLRRVRGELSLAMLARATCVLVLAVALGQLVAGSGRRDDGTGVHTLLLLTALVAIPGWLWLARRAWRLRDLTTVALWVEHRVPALRYALVTRLEAADEGPAGALDAMIAPVPFERLVRGAIWRPVWPLVAGALVVGAVAIAQPFGAEGPTRGDRRGGPLARALGVSRVRDALGTLTVTVTPPPYSGRPVQRYDAPTRVAGLIGSTVRIDGRTGDAPVQLALPRDTVRAQVDGARWALTQRMPSTPIVLTVLSGTQRRALLLEPITDSVPIVTLEQPARDTVLRVARGALVLAAQARDDIGLRDVWFEVVVSAGEGENFTFRTTTIGRRAVGRAVINWQATLSLDSLTLVPGDLVHVRAVARDGNTVTGPGLAGSDTRAIRVARADEYDSVAVDGAPPPEALKGLLSQRLLIQLAEALEKQRRTLSREPFVRESRRLARDQNALRRQVGDIIFQRLEDLGAGGEHSHDDGHDHSLMTPAQLLAEAREATSHAGEALDFAGGESPVVAINRPLLEAYNAMWDASSELGIGEPRRALPHMRAALDAIQRARAAERIYLRGRPKDIIVDLTKARLAGKTDRIGPAARAPRESDEAPRLARLARFDEAVATLPGAAESVIATLLTLRAEVLGTPAADALGAAADALRAGGDVTAPLVRARRALAGDAAVVRPLGAWSRAP